jgi:polyhydroxyalkanoate synthase
MAFPFNTPEEFVQGFFKSGQSLLHAFTGMSGDAPASAGALRREAPAGSDGRVTGKGI